MTGALFLLALAIYLYLGTHNLGGGFGSWWKITIGFFGADQLFRLRWGSGLTLLGFAVLSYVKPLSFWDALLVLVALLAVSAIVQRLINQN